MNPRYQCPVCEKFKPVDRSALSVGDRVTFTFVTQRQYRNQLKFNYKTVKGNIQQIQGEQLTVSYGKKQYCLDRDDVSPAGAPSKLTYTLFGTCTCGVGGSDE
ncbi:MULTISPECIES: hypothetical protein [Xenorhabdus]|uniref:hypothetical protein n=2 Tax=Xenorhabdus TaxID=626 RepID=UPI00064A7551|nr:MULTISPECIES: hypothetical protein [Xenorhabdus]KLU14796.1 hypothetical protein AAY47_14320 [Xenorhabdus griffiniae]KOP31880.1 hypothetical protein AFK69_18515 [Xenorhabdus sp. GDc328]